MRAKIAMEGKVRCEMDAGYNMMHPPPSGSARSWSLEGGVYRYSVPGYVRSLVVCTSILIS